MFQIGDRIVHPLHGAGIITDLVEQTIDGVRQTYYELHLALEDTRLLLPVDRCAQLGVRPVCSRAQAEQVLAALGQTARHDRKGWNQRYRENMQHLRSGDLMEVAQVIQTLTERDQIRSLSTGEHKMLVSARQILISELAFALELTPQQAEQRLDAQLFAQCRAPACTAEGD